jgi:UDP-N-acetylmuramoyl-tripeptide--D-alanyl-D-alanine ligase
MRAALSLLKRLAAQGRRVAVLGDMYELGLEEVGFHRQIGEYAFVNGVDELLTVGQLGGEIAAGALAVGMPARRVHACADVTKALAVLEDIRREDLRREGVRAGSVILVKASRGMKLERVVEGLLEQTEDSHV